METKWTVLGNHLGHSVGSFITGLNYPLSKSYFKCILVKLKEKRETKKKNSKRTRGSTSNLNTCHPLKEDNKIQIINNVTLTMFHILSGIIKGTSLVVQ